MRTMIDQIHLYTIIFIGMVVFFMGCNSGHKGPNADQQLVAPDAVGKEVQLKYTDSGRLRAVLHTPLILDYTSKKMGYREFPEGLLLHVFDPKGQKTVVRADYGISYVETGLIDLQGNVDIRTPDSVHLKAPQLFWDQKQHWVFTDHPYSVRFANGSYNDGAGFDANQDFTNFNSRANTGDQILEE